jgi:hypothetical protein
MTARVALIVSVIFHPVFVNLFAFLLLFQLHPILAAALSTKAKIFYSLFFFTATAIVPLLSVLILKKGGMIASILLQQAHERRLPYLVTAAMTLVTYYIFQKINAPGALQFFVLICSAIVVTMLLFNQYKKLSIHMASLGLLTGVILIFYPYLEVRALFSVVLIISGITASARLFAEAHTPIELLSGYLIGFSITILLM